MSLLGREEREAVEHLRQCGAAYRVVRYDAARPYQDADSSRVIRVSERDGEIVLVVGRFCMKPKQS